MIYEAIDYWNSPYLEHHGVKGMKWGVRHDKLKNKVDRAFNKVDSLNYTIHDYNFYSDKKSIKAKKKAEKKRDKILRKANKLYKKQKEMESKRTSKMDRIRNRRVKVSDFGAKLSTTSANNIGKEIDSLKKDKFKSPEWENYLSDRFNVRIETNDYGDSRVSANSLSDLNGYLYTAFNKGEFNRHISDLAKEKQTYETAAKKWINRSNKLKKMKVSYLTTKQDISKIFRS